MNKNVAQKAAKWWADQLRGNAELDNGDNSITGAMSFNLATKLQETKKQKQSPELIDKFELELTNVIMEQDRIRTIRVEYRPDALLQEAADRAELPLGMSMLPWKTTMRIDGEKVSVRCGYDAESVAL
jgi:hypothetical protein